VKPFIWPVQVYYEDTDSAGVVYYANYLKYMERARTELMRSVPSGKEILQAGELVFVVRAANLEFFRPGRFNDLLEVRTLISDVQLASVLFEHVIVRADAPEVALCEGRVKVVCVATDSFRPKPIPQTLLMEAMDEH